MRLDVSGLPVPALRIIRDLVHPRQHSSWVRVRELGRAALRRDEVKAGPQDPIQVLIDLTQFAGEVTGGTDEIEAVLLRQGDGDVRACLYSPGVRRIHQRL